MDPSRVTPEDLRDPTIDAETLRQIALARPDLRSRILQHPNCHAELTAYIHQLPEQSPPPPGTPYPPAGQPQSGQRYQPYTPGYASQPAVDPSDEKVWGVIMHLGNLLLSFLVPLIIWLIYRERSQTLDQQGRAALNWAISFWIYSAIAGILMFILVGFVIWPILVVLDIVFCIIAAVKAGNGQAWKYPMSIPFLRVSI